MLSPASALARTREERGFTLVETLVAMVTGIVVTGALFAILEFSVRQTSRISQVAQATQVSRGAMTHILDELHSACLATGFAPVQETSSPTKLVFQNGYSEEAEVPGVYTSKGGSTGLKTEGARTDTIEEKTGTLTDFVELGTGGEPGTYTFGAKTPVRLAEHVSQAEIVNAKKEAEKPPIFRYYEYAGASSTGTGEAAATLTEVKLAAGEELKTKAKGIAAKVAAVQVSFRTAASTKEVKLGASSESGTSADLTSLTTFAFSAPDSESTIAAGPCE
jgi:type II secretory pathway pseudopilin PulG